MLTQSFPANGPEAPTGFLTWPSDRMRACPAPARWPPAALPAEVVRASAIQGALSEVTQQSCTHVAVCLCRHPDDGGGFRGCFQGSGCPGAREASGGWACSIPPHTARAPRSPSTPLPGPPERLHLGETPMQTQLWGTAGVCGKRLQIPAGLGPNAGLMEAWPGAPGEDGLGTP